MESLYNNDPPDLEIIMYIRPTVPRKERTRLIDAEILNNFTLLFNELLETSLINTGTKITIANTYSVEKVIVSKL